MKKKLLIIISFWLLISCDYTKQQRELTELKRQNTNLSNKVKRFEIDSIFRISELEKNPHRIKAHRIIDSLKFNDPETLKNIELEFANNSVEFDFENIGEDTEH